MSTRLCTDPYAIQPISINECIGLSLYAINAYYNIVLDDTCLQSEEAQQLTNDVLALSADIYALSADILSFPKAYVSFGPNLSTSSGTYKMFTSYNVSQVSATNQGVGTYDIFFTTNFPNTSSFGAIATCSQVSNTNGYGQAVIGTFTSVSSVRVRIENKGGLISTSRPKVVAVTVFGNK